MNLNILTAFQQAILAILILLGNIVFVSIFLVIIRRHFFERKLKDFLENSKAGRKVKNKIDEEIADFSTRSASDHKLRARVATGFLDDVISRAADNAIQPMQHDGTTVHRRRTLTAQPNSNQDWKRSHHQTGLGFFPAPWQISGVRKAVHWLFRRMGEPPHEKNHHYLSFVPTLDFKVGVL